MFQKNIIIQHPCAIGECVPYYLCANGSIITDGAGILDSRLGSDDDPEPQKHPCPDFFDTCCTLKTKDNTFTKDITIIPVHDRCGVRNRKGAGFEISPHDKEAQFGKCLPKSNDFSKHLRKNKSLTNN